MIGASARLTSVSYQQAINAMIIPQRKAEEFWILMPIVLVIN